MAERPSNGESPTNDAVLVLTEDGVERHIGEEFWFYNVGSNDAFVGPWVFTAGQALHLTATAFGLVGHILNAAVVD